MKWSVEAKNTIRGSLERSKEMREGLAKGKERNRAKVDCSS
jgi:hypothetical protein